MHNKIIQSNKTTLYLKDSGIKNSLLSKKSIIKLLKQTLIIFENYCWGKNNKSKNFTKLGITSIEFSLTFCGTYKIKSLNTQHLNKSRTTDVISFPLNDFAHHENPDRTDGSHINLGDIFICKEVALLQSLEYNSNFNQEIVELLVHGLLHLYGWDHELSRAEEKYMFAKEEILVKNIFRKK